MSRRFSECGQWGAALFVVPTFCPGEFIDIDRAIRTVQHRHSGNAGVYNYRDMMYIYFV
jgi:hypothetical protein